MFSRLSDTYKALILCLLAYLSFSVSDTAVKILTPHYSIYQIGAGDVGISLILFLLFSPKLGGLQGLKDMKNWKVHLIRGVCNFGATVLTIYLFSTLPMTSVYTAGFLSPFIMTLIAIPLYREKVGPHRWIAMIAGFSGILIAFRPWEEDISLLKFLTLLGMPLGYSIMHSMMRKMKEPRDLPVGFYPMLFTFIPLVVLSFTAADFVPFALPHLIPLFVSGACLVLSLVLVSRAYHMGDASLVAPVQYTQMLWGVLLGAFIFGDLPNGWEITGSGVIIISGLYLLHREHKVKTSGGVSPNTLDAF